MTATIPDAHVNVMCIDSSTALALHRGAHALHLRRIGDPQGEVEQRRAMVKECPAARLGAAKAPAFTQALELIGVGANAGDFPELPALDEPREGLHIGAKAVV